MASRRLEEKEGNPGPLAFEVFLKVCVRCPSSTWDLAKGLDTMTVRGVRISVETPITVMKSLLNTKRFRLHLRMDDLYNEPLDLSQTTVTHFTANEVYNSPIVLPHGIFEARFGNRFNTPVLLPLTLKKLTVGGAFDRAVVIPKSLEEFNCGYHFDRMITFPPGGSLTKLTLGYMFDQRRVELPESIRHLVLNCNMAVRLPSRLQILELSNYFKKPITLPSGLLEVVVGYGYPLPLQNLGRSIQHVTYGGSNLVDLSECYNLKSVTCTGKHPEVTLPQTLTLVKAVFKGTETSSVSFPPSVEHIEWHSTNSVELAHVDSLRHLVLEGDFNDEEVELPPGLLTLETPTFTKAIFKCEKVPTVVLPPSTEHLEWCSEFPLELTQQLSYVAFGGRFAQDVILPDSVLYCHFAKGYKGKVVLNEGLERLYFGVDYSVPIVLPSSLREVGLPDWHYFLLELPVGCTRVSSK